MISRGKKVNLDYTITESEIYTFSFVRQMSISFTECLYVKINKLLSLHFKTLEND